MATRYSASARTGARGVDVLAVLCLDLDPPKGRGAAGADRAARGYGYRASWRHGIRARSCREARLAPRKGGGTGDLVNSDELNRRADDTTRDRNSGSSGVQ